MYESHFGLHRQPFQCAELSRAFFVSEAIRSILPPMLHALRSDLGIAVLTGPAGVGKTSLLKYLQSQLLNEGRVIVCSGASLDSPAEVLMTLQNASQLRAGGMASSETAPPPDRIIRWNVVDHLRKSSEFWGPVLLLIDDAQLLSVQVLNELRAFSEEESNGRCLVRCLISGPMTLEEELARPGHADFSRRIRCHMFLQPLTSRESIEFLSRHLEAVGGKLLNLFTSASLELIASAADGIPRCLSLLADESLVVAVEASLKFVDESCVQKALTRLQHLPYSWNTSPLADEISHGASDTEGEGESHSLIHTASPLRSNVLAGIGGRSSPTNSVHSSVVTSSIVEFGGGTVIELCAKPAKSPAHAQRIPDAPRPPQDEQTKAVEPPPKNADFEVGRRFAIEDANVPDPTGSDELYSIADAAVDFEEPEWLRNEDSSGILYGDNHRLSPGGQLDPPDMPPEPKQFEWNCGCKSIECDAALEQGHPLIASDPFSNRMPVFDRYTWIALGRDMPAGAHFANSAANLQEVSATHRLNGECSDLLEELDFGIGHCPVTAFDHIAVTQTSDLEIIASLTTASCAANHGDFVLFQTHPALGLNCDDERHAEDIGPSDTPLQHVDSAAHLKINYFTGFEDCVSSGNQDLRSTDTVRAERSASIAPPRIWDDGQLLFGPKPAAEPQPYEADTFHSIEASGETPVCESTRPAELPKSDANLVREGQVFTLPVPLKASEWDLRSLPCDRDEITPLAESVAAFREEVSQFQQGIRWIDTACPDTEQRLNDLPTSSHQMPSEPIAALSEETVADTDASKTTGLAPSVDPAPRYGQLFTRLRQLRNQSDEAR